MSRPRGVKMLICVAITYDHPQIPRDCLPALLVGDRFGVHWWPLYWFPRDAWPWFPNRLGRLSA